MASGTSRRTSTGPSFHEQCDVTTWRYEKHHLAEGTRSFSPPLAPIALLTPQIYKLNAPFRVI
ncbi:hypothetical protein N7497_009609 [Penicillium chrysogenum]|nr:hypothetical protein N7497_009609 [Penicillium chrysogenum]